jgi:SAM-dependent methyltransferase
VDGEVAQPTALTCGIRGADRLLPKQREGQDGGLSITRNLEFMLGKLTRHLDQVARLLKRPEPVSREIVVRAYQRLLGRDPESEDVIAEKMAFSSPFALIEAILDSAEYAARGGSHMDNYAGPLDVDWQVEPDVVAALLARISEAWRQLGQKRPYQSVQTGPQFSPENMTAERQQAFYDSGADDLRMLLATLLRVGRRPVEFPVVFEFGCGLGRVTSHLCKQFSHVIATDVSPSHLAKARHALNERRTANVGLNYATAADFGMSESYDLWFNRLVLQHNPPPLIAAILDRAMTLLRPRGLAIFQVPVYSAGYRFKIDEYLQSPVKRASSEMHLLPQSVILDLANRAGCRLLEIRQEGSAGMRWISQFFTFEKS